MPVPKPADQRELLAEIAKGDKRSFGQLFQAYHHSVLSFARRIARSESLAEEVLQETFLKIWLNREKLSEIENFGGYLNVIVRNECLQLLRKLKREVLDSGEYLEAAQPSYNTEQELDFRESKQILQAAIGTLTPHQRTVYQLCHQDGLKYEEAARQLGITTHAVHAHMKEALKRIRLHFKKNALGYTAFFLALFK